MMWHDLTHISVPGIELVIRGAVVYIAVVILLRLGGKRQLAQMSPTEFVAVLLISNAVQNSMNGGDNSLVGGLILAAVLVATSWLISRLTYGHHRWRHVFEGTPTLLVENGKIVAKHLEAERITLEELDAMLRRVNIYNLAEVKFAVLGTDGQLDVIRN